MLLNESNDMSSFPPDALRRKFTLRAASLVAGAALPLESALARPHYPNRPITFICPWPNGGTADVTMRVLARVLANELNQKVEFRNVAGVSGMVGTRMIVTAKPDGYTIGQIPISVTRFALLDKLTFDPLKDISFLARTSGQTFGIVVHAESPFKTLEQLVAAARLKPGRLTYATAGTAGATHVGMEEFLLSAGVKMHHVAYKGGAPALADLLGGQVDALADSSSWSNEVKRGSLRLLATWGTERVNGFPNVPTLRELGFDVVVDAPNGIGAPAGLAPPVASKLRMALRKAVLSQQFKKACDSIHAPVQYQDADDYRKYVVSEHAHQKRLIERINLG